MNRYVISPSLLDKVTDYINATETWDKYWGGSDNPSKTLEQYQQQVYGELIDYIKGVKTLPSEAADLGTCLNEAVDRLLGNAPRPDVRIETSVDTITAIKDCSEWGIFDRTFTFDRAFVESLALMFKGSVAQMHLSNDYTTPQGDITLHGFADYIFPTMIWDMKTTGKYEAEKYANYWQRHLYPVVAVDSGDMTLCERFTFYALEVRPDDRGYINAKPFAESYDVNIDASRDKLLEFITSVVIPFLDYLDAQGIIPEGRIIEKGGAA